MRLYLGSIALAAALSVSVQAVAGNFKAQFTGQWPADLRDGIEQTLTRPETFMGMKNSVTDEGWSFFCNHSIESSAFWKLSVGDFQADIDPVSSVISFHVEFDNSIIDFSSFGHGGLLCEWTGGGARVHLRNLAFDFVAEPVVNNGVPKVHLQSLKMTGFTLDQIMLATPFYSMQQGEAPEWVSDAFESGFNSLVATIISSSAGKIVDRLGASIAGNYLVRHSNSMISIHH